MSILNTKQRQRLIINKDILMPFNPTKEQELIFNFFHKGKGHGMIDAVAGSGKTTTIIQGISYIDSNKQILFCAFNKKIQLEIHKKTNDYDNVIVRTTYALGLNILKHSYDVIGYKAPNTSKYYHILNNKLKRKKDSYEYEKPSKFTLIFDKIRDHYYRLKKQDEVDNFYKIFYSNYYKLTDLMRYTLYFSQGVNKFKLLIEKYGIDINSDDKQITELYLEFIELVIEEGINQATEKGVYDFADMIFLPCHLKLKARHHYDIVFVDECQDLSNAQLKVITKHIKKQGRLFAVGDPFQSIYGFAGASEKSFNNIQQTFEPSMFKLTNCFRCDKKIIELAKEIRTDITTMNTNEGSVEKIQFNEIIEHARQSDYVLSRSNSDLFDVVFEFLKVNIKCKIIGKTEILKELKNLVPNKKLYDEYYFENLVEHLENIFKAAKVKLGNNPANFDKLENLRDSINILETCYFNSDDTNNLDQLFKFIEKLMDGKDEDSVILSSIHKAKGLEANRVFILEYNNLPRKIEGMLDWQIYQEKCLKYVAITRAKNTLFLVEPLPEKNQIFMKNNEVIDMCDLDDDIDNLAI
ncbi:UvrD-helicase domain-containing protein [Kordia sp.]|uniref:UvrD-helicase domain-containing protein n=1 Tax=Kordia sp. TaxID=1965332 RepID=UPI003D2DD70A